MIDDRFPPSKALKKYCIQCLGLNIFNRAEIENCQGDKAKLGPCPLYPYRLGDKRPSVRVFRRYCLYCTQGDKAYVDECPTMACPLRPYRYGTNPSLTGKRPNVAKNLSGCAEKNPKDEP